MARNVSFQINIGSNSGEITADIEKLKEALDRVKSSAERVGETMVRTAAHIAVFEKLNNIVGQVSRAVGDLASSFNGFDKGMRAVNTMAGKGAEEFAALKDEVTELSRTIPLAREELASGLYQVISNGVPEENWISFLEQSAKAAVGGIADLGETVTVTSTLIKNYGLGWDSVAEIQDKIQTTAKNGVTSFAELGQALPKVSGTAAKLGVTIDELMAAFATTTGVTGNTAEVATQLSAVLTALVKPSAEATKAANEMGIGFNAGSVAAAGGLENFLLGLDKTITEYAAKTGQLSDTIYGKLFGSARALTLLGSLTGEQKEAFSQNIAAMGESVGAIDAAFGEMSSTGESVSAMLKNQMQAMTDCAGRVASAAQPYVDYASKLGISIMGALQLYTAVKSLNASFLLEAASAAKATIAIKAKAAAVFVASKAAAAWSAVQRVLNLVLSANPIGIIVSAIGILVAALVSAYKCSDEFRAVCGKVWEVVKRVAAVVWDSLCTAFEAASGAIKKAWEWLKNFLGIGGDGVEETTETISAQTEALKENASAADKAAAAQGRLQVDKKNNEGSTVSNYDGSALIANANTYKALGNNIKFYQAKLEECKATDAEAIALYARKIEALKALQAAIEEQQAAATRPDVLNTLEDIDKEIAYQTSLRNKASDEQLRAIDKEIHRLNELRAAKELNAYTPTSVAAIENYEQLDRELEYYEGRLKTASEAERMVVQKQLVALQHLKKQWDETLEAVAVPESIDKLNTLEELSEAISYYQTQQKRASADEIANIQRTITALESKKEAYERGISLPKMSIETDRLNGLNDEQLKIELQLIGLDEVRKKLRELQQMLGDKVNPLSDGQRAEVEALIESYTSYADILEKIGRASEVQKGLNGVSSALSSVGDMLDDTAASWMNWGAKILDAISSAIGPIEAFISALAAKSAATAVNTTLTEANTVADATNTATHVADNAAKQASDAALLSTEATLAAVQAGKSVSSIPIVGAIMAVAAIASVVAAIASIPKFASGGIAYGPTLGLFGEYAGAGNNPEVVAPLNKLKDLLQLDGGNTSGAYVQFKISGRDLVGVLNREANLKSRT